MTSAQSTSATALVAEGHAKLQTGHLREAEDFYRRALALDPGQPEALAFLGMMAGQAGQLRIAIEFFERALKRAPRNADIHHNLGETWRHLGDNVKALACFERAATLNPNHLEAYRSGADTALAEAARRQAAGQWSGAAALKRTAVELLIHAGRLLRLSGNLTAAADILWRGTEIDSSSAPAWAWYGGSLIKSYPSRAAAALRRSIELDPKVAWVHGLLSDALFYLRLHDEARAEWQAIGRIDPAYYDRRPVLNLVQLLPLYQGGDKSELFALHRAWGEAAARHQTTKEASFKNGRDPTRRLRVGFVSGDFRMHSVAYFLEPLFAARDGEAFEIVCYSTVHVGREDRTTARLRASASEWRNVAMIDDEAFRRQVRADKIDILIDLAGHFDNSRIVAFAVKPAPVTATWLGYPATTGLGAIDWRITDDIADPAGEEAFHTENLMRLSGGFLCYGPPADAPPVAPPPVAAKGHVTFGSFNNQIKINRRVIRTWAQILKAVPTARLIMKSELLDDDGVAARLRQGFVEEGIAIERIDLRPWINDARDHLTAYGDVDIALDPFPYNGTTTTCEALWMGVPVITLIGDRHSARVGLDLLTRVGLERFAAPDVDSYVQTATALAADRVVLSALRAELRERVARSPLCDAGRFAREFETALRAAWRQWCAV